MRTILCYGDSNTYGYNPQGGRYGREVRWPAQLGRLLGPDYEVVDEGCNNRTTDIDDPEGDWLNGLTSLRVCLASHYPIDLVVVMLGTNDLKHRFGRTTADVAQGVERIVAEAQSFTRAKQGVPAQVLLVSPIHIGWREENYPCTDFNSTSAEHSRELAELYRQVAERRGCLFLDAAQVAEPGQIDLVHLTSEGHADLAQAVARAVDQALK